MPPLLHFVALFAVCLLAAAGVFVKGRKILGSLMGLAITLYAAGMQYIINSPELPGFTEELSPAYMSVRAVTDISLFVYLVSVALVCWGVGTSNQPLKRTS